jgi:hypothetical protein
VTTRLLLFFGITFFLANAAEPICPWLNAATAGGFLQGSVHVAVTRNGEDANCEFTRENSADKLRIEVVALNASRDEIAACKAECEAPLAPLRAIGNEQWPAPSPPRTEPRSKWWAEYEAGVPGALDRDRGYSRLAGCAAREGHEGDGTSSWNVVLVQRAGTIRDCSCARGVAMFLRAHRWRNIMRDSRNSLVVFDYCHSDNSTLF